MVLAISRFGLDRPFNILLSKKCMKNLIKLLFLGCLGLFFVPTKMGAQASPNCETIRVDDYYIGRTFFNHGSVSNSVNTKIQLSATVGQTITGSFFGTGVKGGYGFWAGFTMPPKPPSVLASQGDLEDRIEIKWTPDPLSPAATSYKVYRNNSLLATLDGETYSFMDFNVIAGTFYTYSVSGINSSGEGNRSSALGHVNPNGVVTGRITSSTGNPVVETIVTISPTLGSSLRFSGDDMAFTDYNSKFPRSNFTLSAWMKLDSVNDSTAIFDMGSNLSKNWWLHTLPAAAGKGVRFGVGKGGNQKTELNFTFPVGTESNWHNIAASYNGNALLLYIDGNLVGSTATTISTDSIPLFFGQTPTASRFFKGHLDEVRFFNRQLAQTEVQLFMKQSGNSDAKGLVAYWKFDEGVGNKAFDVTGNRFQLYFCGPEWDKADKPDVVNAAISNENGFYKIVGVNYGAGTTFNVSASKNFYFNQSLEFNASNLDFARLTNFALRDSATITASVNGFDLSGKQVILSKADNAGANQFAVFLNAGNIEVMVGSTTQQYGSLGLGFHHLAFVLQRAGTNLTVTFYKDGVLNGAKSFPTTNWTGLPWRLGARAVSTNTHNDYFTGLIDEVAFFSQMLPLNTIQKYASDGTGVTDTSLISYFNLNEGMGTSLKDIGTALTGDGQVFGARWSSVTAIIQSLPHDFSPSISVVTLNPSNTSADKVDFTDLSTIPVSCYVRFENTNCFQAKVEILVNGKSNVPQIFTNNDGRFSADFEPGKKIVLTPKFEDHTFFPATWEIPNIAAPMSGILFRNQVKRSVTGQMAGGICRKSIIPSGAIAKVKIATLNGCFEKVVQLSENGKFIFNGIPADSVTLTVIEHSNPVIYNFFQKLGGQTISLKMSNDTVDFIYLAPPNVELTPLDTNLCGDPMLDMLQRSKTTVRVFEQYDGGKCYLQNALLTINNNIASLPQFDTLMSGGSLVHSFRVEAPNIVAPFFKQIQVTATSNGEKSTASLQAVVLGRRPRQTTFTSSSPSIPFIILRDPPGDASYSYIEEGQTVCESWAFSATDSKDTEGDVTLSLGPDIELEAGTPFFSVGTAIDATADLGYTFSSNVTNLASEEMEMCITSTRTISTSDNDIIVGGEMGGDVYVGGAMNFLYGITDELLYDTANCSFYLDKGMFMFPDGFATTFLYTEYHIINNIIPALTLLGDTTSVKTWESIIADNDKQKKEAVFAKNLSFDAGVVYEESETTENSKSKTTSWVQNFSDGYSQAFGLTVNGIGATSGLAINWTKEQSKDTTKTTVDSRTVGYVLADDDIGDNFTVNIKKDKTYGTPVFETVSGQTQCPFEPNTQPREGVDLAADRQVAINVPMNEPAIFKLKLGNKSQSEESKSYSLASSQESNPLGAVILFNGQEALNVGVPFGQSVEVIMTVYRGPEAFTYENLSVSLFSDCEADRAGSLSIDVDSEFNEDMEFDVYFLEPCSPIDIGFPLQNWVLTPNSGDTMLITLNEFNRNDVDLELIRVQYRRKQGDGAWINIAEVLKADLDNDVFKIVKWGTAGFKDGEYEIRALTQCIGGLNAGISNVILGRFERQAPEMFGTPEPIDGVFSIGDEISITFNEQIKCDGLIKADVFNNNNVGLYDVSTGTLIDAIISCSKDKIIITPNVPNKFIENKTLQVRVNNISDLAGNKFLEKKWDFFVDRNPISWSEDQVNVIKLEEETITVTRKLVNSGGQVQNYELKDLPNWVKVLPLVGTLQPGAFQVITFEFDNSAALGHYRDTIFAESAQGSEPLYLDFRVVCPDPVWNLNREGYSFSMNMTLELNIDGTVSKDNRDIVGAFIGRELRGLGRVQYNQELKKHLVFMTVYSNVASGDTVKFQVWDASACKLYGKTIESFKFEPDGLIGSPFQSQVLRTNNLLLVKIPIQVGWNWISYNVGLPDPTVEKALESLSNPKGATIKSQTAFSSYSTSLLSWVGSLKNLSHLSMYQYQSASTDSLLLLGSPLDPTMPIPVVSGWNWIGFLPQRGMPVTTALSSLKPQNGDLIKGQFTFAQYVTGLGWLGNLTYMSSPNGYLLKLSSPGTLIYPKITGNNLQTDKVEKGKLPSTISKPGHFNYWKVKPVGFEQSMNIIALVERNGQGNILDDGDEVGAFFKDELRGVSEVIYVKALDAYLIFLTVFANFEGETIRFKFFDSSESKVFDLNESILFKTNTIKGLVEKPQLFTISSPTAVSNLALENQNLEVYPNPASEIAFIQLNLTENEALSVQVTDAFGRELWKSDVEGNIGVNKFEWKISSDLPSGWYFVTVKGKNGLRISKIEVLR
jgi:hypothetical protein